MTQGIWQGFYKLSHSERIARLKAGNILNASQAEDLLNGQSLNLDTANEMIENMIGQYSLPFGLALNHTINEHAYTIPMVVEEPSVIAASSYAGKLISQSGGMHTHVQSRLMTGELAILNVTSPTAAEQLNHWVEKHKKDLLQIANAAHPSIVKRGGGAKEIQTTYYQKNTTTAPFFVIYLSVDTQEAMGANMMNTMLEALKQHLTQAFIAEGWPYEVFMAILSNYTTACLVTATCEIPARILTRDSFSGETVAERIALASQFAQVDPYRASTHNKGIMNGIDAVVIATGNDWRALEAAAHTYASRDGQYRGLATWTYDKTRKVLTGELTLPVPIGTVGGSIGIHPTSQIAHQLLGNPDAQTLMTIIANVGLAQNLAALRALVSEGIQAGHMHLQAKSLAIQVGASPAEASLVAEQLLQAKYLNQATAKALLKKIRQDH